MQIVFLANGCYVVRSLLSWPTGSSWIFVGSPVSKGPNPSTTAVFRPAQMNSTKEEKQESPSTGLNMAGLKTPWNKGIVTGAKFVYHKNSMMRIWNNIYSELNR